MNFATIHVDRHGIGDAISRDANFRRILFSKIDNVRTRDFQVLGLIGYGDVGRVYLVTRSSGDVVIPSAPPGTNLFALKVCAIQDLEKRSKIHRFCSERNILASTTHPYIMHLYASFADERNFYLLLEHCIGGEFARVLKRQPSYRLPEETVRYYAAEIVVALEYLHLQGVLYRDLKTENVLVHADGHIRLTDFDLAKEVLSMDNRLNAVGIHVLENAEKNNADRNMQAAGSNVKAAKSSKKSSAQDTPREVLSTGFSGLGTTASSNSLVGTPEYLAPEVIYGPSHSQGADWWTLGIFIFECVYGFTPFKANSVEMMFQRIRQGVFIFPEKPKVSKQFKDICKRLLQVEPKNRLGYTHGAAEVKAHPWFKPVQENFTVKSQNPPLKTLTLLSFDQMDERQQNIIKRQEALMSEKKEAPAKKRKPLFPASDKSGNPKDVTNEMDPATIEKEHSVLLEQQVAFIVSNTTHTNIGQIEIIVKDFAGTGFKLPPECAKFVPKMIKIYEKSGLPSKPRMIKLEDILERDRQRNSPATNSNAANTISAVNISGNTSKLGELQPMPQKIESATVGAGYSSDLTKNDFLPIPERKKKTETKKEDDGKLKEIDEIAEFTESGKEESKDSHPPKITDIFGPDGDISTVENEPVEKEKSVKENKEIEKKKAPPPQTEEGDASSSRIVKQEEATPTTKNNDHEKTEKVSSGNINQEEKGLMMDDETLAMKEMLSKLNGETAEEEEMKERHPNIADIFGSDI